MGSGMKYHVRTVGLKDSIQSVFIANGSDQVIRIQVWKFLDQLLLQIKST